MKNQKMVDQALPTKKSGIMIPFILKHKMVFFLLFVLLIVVLWSIIKIALIENKYNDQVSTLKSNYDNKIDSLKARHLELTSKVFSWAVRSELIRDNKEQVNQFFLNFIKEPGITKVSFVDATTSQVSLSTDKKMEGTFYTNFTAIATDQTIHTNKDSVLTVISPVMGLNNKLGVLIIESVGK